MVSERSWYLVRVSSPLNLSTSIIDLWIKVLLAAAIHMDSLRESRNSFKTIMEVDFLTVLFNTFMRQALTDDFWGSNKNTNCAFPLKSLCNYYFSENQNRIVKKMTFIKNSSLKVSSWRKAIMKIWGKHKEIFVEAKSIFIEFAFHRLYFYQI